MFIVITEQFYGNPRKFENLSDAENYKRNLDLDAYIVSRNESEIFGVFSEEYYGGGPKFYSNLSEAEDYSKNLSERKNLDVEIIKF